MCLCRERLPSAIGSSHDDQVHAPRECDNQVLDGPFEIFIARTIPRRRLSKAHVPTLPCVVFRSPIFRIRSGRFAFCQSALPRRRQGSCCCVRARKLPRRMASTVDHAWVHLVRTCVRARRRLLAHVRGTWAGRCSQKWFVLHK